MAHSLRRPLYSAVTYSSSSISSSSSCCTSVFFLHPRRNFADHSRALPKAPQAARKVEQSIRILSREKASSMPSDLGLLDGTFVTPDRQKLPSYFRSPRTRIKLEYQRIQAFLRDRFSLLVLKFASPRDLNRRFGRSIKLQNSQLVPTALALHREMYTAFAEADLPTLRRLCTDGLYDSFRARIGSRPRGEQVVWELTDYKKPARLVSNRAARFPIDGSAVRQAVVRIWSRQKLTRYAANGTEVGGAGKVKDIVEYVVVQKIYSQWKADEWQVWGTTKETQLENIGPKEP